MQVKRVSNFVTLFLFCHTIFQCSVADDKDEVRLKKCILLLKNSNIKILPKRLHSLRNIKKSDCSRIAPINGNGVQGYRAILLNGDRLVCERFQYGPCKGDVSCARILGKKYKKNVVVTVPIISDYFDMLENMYNVQNHEQ